MSRAFVILGSPRSGTSLVAGILERLGVYMGERFVPPGQFNQAGAYENLDFVELNNRIMAAIKGDEYGVPNPDRLSKAPEIFADEARAVIEKNERELWGWKDMRTNFTLPVYKPWLENPTYIVVRRDKKSIIKSLMNVGNPEDRAVNTVKAYYQRARYNTEGEDRVFVHYEEFIYAPESTVRWFAETLNLDGDINKAVDFIDPSLKHF